MCIMQVGDQRVDRQAFVDIGDRGGNIFRQEVDHCQEGTGIYTVLAAYLSDILFSESQGDSKTTHHKNHRVVLAYQIAHLVGFPVFPVFIHKFYYSFLNCFGVIECSKVVLFKRTISSVIILSRLLRTFAFHKEPLARSDIANPDYVKYKPDALDYGGCPIKRERLSGHRCNGSIWNI